MSFGRVSGVMELRWHLAICSLALKEKQGREGGAREGSSENIRNMAKSHKAARD